jgi:mitochondrial import receptor subunit TOM40
MLQTELDYLGSDYSLNTKVINPDVAAQTGIMTASYLQSLTKHFAVGAEVVGQRMNREEPIETGFSVGAKYATSKSTITANLQQLAALQVSYFQKVSPNVELGSELQLLMVGGNRSDALCTVAAKFDYKQALVRTQVDSAGKVGLLYEEKIYPGFSLLLAGEIDHAKATSRFGLGINMES